MSKILHADDDSMLRDIVSKSCKYGGFEITSVPNGEAAWDQIQAQCPDLLITDMNMGTTMNGLKLARKCREAGHKFPIIIFSSALDDTQKAECSLLEAPLITLEKPMWGVALIAIIRAMLGK